MIGLKNYKGCRIFLHDEAGRDLMETTVLSHNISTMTITVQGILEGVKMDSHISALILADDGVHEFMGTVRKYFNTTISTEIALFHGQIKKESRSSRRYNVNTRARVLGLISDSGPMPFLNPLEVSLANLSVNGALIKTKPESFQMNNIFELELPIGDKITALTCRIVRIRNTNEQETEYGCLFLTIKRRERGTNTWKGNGSN